MPKLTSAVKGTFPPSITTTITLYCYYKDIGTGLAKCERCVLDGVFWDDSSIAVERKTGIQVKRNIVLYVPHTQEISGREYVPPAVWKELSKEEITTRWTIDESFLRYTAVVKGVCPYEFGWSGGVGSWESDFDDTFEAFEKDNPGNRKPLMVNEQLFGNVERAKHVVITLS